jgi:Fe2+ transport system protein FeoA
LLDVGDIGAVITAVKLQDLKAGDKACVLSLCGSECEIARLAAMGLRGGARLQLLREGSPCILQVDETRLCLRATEELQILVQPEV